MVEKRGARSATGAMAAVREIIVTLRFHGDDLNPDEVSERLGAKPSSAAAKGAIWLTKNGIERVAKTGSWRLRIESEWPDDFNRQLAGLFEQLTPNHDVWRDLSVRFDGNLFVGLFLRGSNEGLSIAPQIVAEIGARGLELGLDIYGPDGN